MGVHLRQHKGCIWSQVGRLKIVTRGPRGEPAARRGSPYIPNPNLYLYFNILFLAPPRRAGRFPRIPDINPFETQRLKNRLATKESWSESPHGPLPGKSGGVYAPIPREPSEFLPALLS